MKKRRPEQNLQRAVVEHLNRRGVPGLLFFHVPNGGKRSIREAAEFKRQGVLPGVSDLLLLHDGKLFALELKAERGRLSEAQREFIDAVNAAGGYAGWAIGVDQATGMLEAWGLIR